jgi:hypothetical protein
MTRALFLCAAVLLVGAHYTGNMKTLTDTLDLGIDMRSLLYVAGLPFTCVAAYILLRD